MLTLTGVVAGYGGGDVLQGVDITVEKGSVACIVGPNGAGKSTVLRTVSGLLSPRLGESVKEAGAAVARFRSGLLKNMRACRTQSTPSARSLEAARPTSESSSR